jgi:tRNA U34 2-thiouridine synthase MnmA/TrmU
MFMKRLVRAIGLLSGGLDSMLATRIILDQGIEVLGLAFVTPFFGPEKSQDAARALGIPLRVVDMTSEHWALLKNPKHGHGKGMNPCIDCHALMLRRAGHLLEETGADFLFTGEVLGQRPFSQNRQSLAVVERESGFAGRILRPLSARLLDETVIEQAGLVDRSRLLDISGRSRKRQMALAVEWEIRDYPTPAGGCLLTDPVFSRRLKDLLKNNPAAEIREVELLKVGRHFRRRPGLKYIVGRNKKENEFMEKWRLPEDGWGRVAGHPGPLLLALGRMEGEDDRLEIAGLCSAYSDAPDLEPISVQGGQGERKWVLQVTKGGKERFRGWMI